MKVLVYTALVNRRAEPLLNTIRTCVPEINMECYTRLDHLFERFRHSTNNLAAAVLAITNQHEFNRILTLRDMVADVRLILVLPSTDRKTTAMAHALSPRFITHLDADLHDVQAVLLKILGRRHTAGPQGKPVRQYPCKGANIQRN